MPPLCVRVDGKENLMWKSLCFYLAFGPFCVWTDRFDPEKCLLPLGSPSWREIENVFTEALCSTKSDVGPDVIGSLGAWASVVTRIIVPHIRSWPDALYTLSPHDCGNRIIALRVAARIVTLAFEPKAEMAASDWSVHDRDLLKLQILSPDALVETLETSSKSNWTFVLLSLLVAYSDLLVVSGKSKLIDQYAITLATKLSRHYTAVSPNLSEWPFCDIPMQLLGQLDPQTLGEDEAMRYLLSHQSLSAGAPVDSFALNACVGIRLAMASNGNPAMVKAFLGQATDAMVMAFTQLTFDMLVWQHPLACTLMWRFLILASKHFGNNCCLPKLELLSTDKPSLDLPIADVLSAEPTEMPLERKRKRDLAMDRKHVVAMYQSLYVVTVLFDKFNIFYFLTHGSLLGAVRNGGIIPHDSDIDVGIFHSDIPKLQSASFKEALMLNGLVLSYHSLIGGFCIRHFSMEPTELAGGDILPMRLDFANSLAIDLWMYSVAQNHHLKIIDRPGYKPNERIEMLLYELLPRGDRVKRVVFGEVEVNIPKGYELFLRQLYGDDWNISNRDRKGNLMSDFVALDREGFVGPVRGPTGPLNRIVKFDRFTWHVGTPPATLFERTIVTSFDD